MMRRSSPISGCHCTPSTHWAPGSSTASTVPSAACAEATSPGASRSTAWWWYVGTDASSSTSEAYSVPGTGVTVCSPRMPVFPNGPAWPSRCWVRVPPIATLSSCMPRQIPSTGVPAARAARSRATSQVSRSCAGGPVLKSRSAPYSPGSTSAPPAITRPSIRATTAAAFAGSSGGSSAAVPPERWTSWG